MDKQIKAKIISWKSKMRKIMKKTMISNQKRAPNKEIIIIRQKIKRKINKKIKKKTKIQKILKKNFKLLMLLFLKQKRNQPHQKIKKLRNLIQLNLSKLKLIP